MRSYYRWSLKKDDNTWWTLQEGAIVTAITPCYLTDNALANWQDTTIEDVRDLEYCGFTRQYGENYQFVHDGYRIVSYLWDYYGANAKASLYVETLDSTTQQYQYSYQADLDFLTAERNSAEGRIILDVLQRGIQERIASRGDMVYEIKLEPHLTKTVEVQPLRVQGKGRWLMGWPPPGEDEDSIQIQGKAGAYLLYNIQTDKDVVPVSDTLENTPIEVFGQSFQFLNFRSPNNCLLRTKVKLSSIKIELKFWYYINNTNPQGKPGTWTVGIKKIDALGNAIDLGLNEIVASLSANQIKSDLFNKEFNVSSLEIDECLVLVAVFDVPNSITNEHQFAIEKDGSINISFEHYTGITPFPVNGISIYNVGKELVARMTDGKGTFDSNLLSLATGYAQHYDLIPRDLIILSGDSVRYSGATLKITWGAYMKSLRSVLGAGYGVEGNTIRVEHREYFYNRDTEIADLGEVADFSEQHCADLLYNKLLIGYENQDYDELNGKEEFNTTYTYELPIENEKNELDLVSPIRADGLGVFYTYVNYSLLDKKDSSSDNDLFLLQIAPAQQTNGFYKALYPQDIKTLYNAVGIAEPGRTMNIGLSPARCALRNGSLLYSLLYTADAANKTEYKMIFRSADKNDKLESSMSQPYMLIEKMDIPLDYFATRLFLPRIYEVKVPAPASYLAIWEQRRNGYFSFTSNGRHYRGFPINCSVNNAQPQEFTYTLLAHPDDIPI